MTAMATSGTARRASWQKRTKTYAESVCESGCACLLTMVHGNFLALTAAHWLTASQTGLIAGTLASSAIIMARLRHPLILSLMLGLVTAVVDFYVHPGHFGTAAATEAIVTGAGAGALSLLLNLGWKRLTGGGLPH